MSPSRKLRVYHLLDGLPADSVGGVQSYVSRLFAAGSFADFEFFILGRPATNQSYRLYQVISSGLKLTFPYGEPDILHIHQIMPYGLGQLLPLSQKYPLLFTMHDYFSFCQRVHFYNPNYSCPAFSPAGRQITLADCQQCLCAAIRNKIYRRCLLFLYQIFLSYRQALVHKFLTQVSKIVLPNPDLFSLLPPFCRQKSVLIPYAIEPEVQNSLPSAICVPAVAASNYVYLGHIVPHKGILQLIKELEEYNFSEELHIFGPPPPHHIRRLLPKFVIHRGLIDDYRRLSNYKGLIVPSLWKETGPLVLQEGLRAGIPVFVRRGAVAKFYHYQGVYEFSHAAEILTSNVPNPPAFHTQSSDYQPGMAWSDSKPPDINQVRQAYFELYDDLRSLK